MSTRERTRSRIRPSISVLSQSKDETVFRLGDLPDGLEFAAMEVKRTAHYAPAGSVWWLWFEYIGERSALLKMPGLLPHFFDIGKGKHRRHHDAARYSVFVNRYANDRWKIRVDARNFESDADIAACIATYWSEPVEVTFLEPAARVAETPKRSHLRLVVDNTPEGGSRMSQPHLPYKGKSS